MCYRSSVGRSHLNLISAGCKARNSIFVKIRGPHSRVTGSSSLPGCDPVSQDSMLTDDRRLEYGV
jgi:hypothetical protein